ncbi:MAG: transposase [Clostridia bacterium]
MQELMRRKRNRLKSYDYAQAGAYFITICSKNRRCIFGDVVDGEMRLSTVGLIVEREIQTHLSIEQHVIMPNHIHMMIVLRNGERRESVGTGLAPVPLQEQAEYNVPDIVRELKSKVSVAVLALCRRKNRQMGKLWQRSYHDHIVRDEKDYRRIYEYIENNPLQWEVDCHNPESEKHKNWIDT